MSKLLDRIQSSLALAGRVRRYHAYPVVYQQTVGEHTQRVATLYVELFGIPRAEVLLHILYHDLGELFGGDSPFGAKREIPALKEATDQAEQVGFRKLGITMPELTEDEWLKFKIADLLEMAEFSCLDHQMGNMFALPIIGNIERAINKLTSENPILRKKAVDWIDDKRMEYFE